MPVELISDRLIVRPKCVFIIPEKRDLHVLDGEFRLKPISKPRGWPDVITVLLRSLTENWTGQMIAVIVYGCDGDGAAALCGIRDVGGITIAQKLDTAGQPDMPQSAIASGCIDFIFSPEEIAQEIAGIADGDLLIRQGHHVDRPLSKTVALGCKRLGLGGLPPAFSGVAGLRESLAGLRLNTHVVLIVGGTLVNLFNYLRRMM